MALATYLNFDGNTREAVHYYADVFGVETGSLMTFGENMPDSPEFQLSEADKQRIMHAQLHINGDLLMFSDTLPGMPYTAGNNFSITYLSTDVDEMQRLFARLAEGGRVDMPLQETSWSPLYGQVTDKFGIAWQFNHDVNLA